MDINPRYVVIISANAEWRVIREILPVELSYTSPYGEWFIYPYRGINGKPMPVVYFEGGWGKVSAAGSTQYAIHKWQPELIVNLGTCGGFAGKIKTGEIILVEKTIIYDIYEQMGDPIEHVQYYMTDLDLSWISPPYPLPVHKTLLLSGDRDLFSKELGELQTKYGAVAGDWESGAIAWIANRNHTPSLILRGVTDLVSEVSGDAYDGKVNYYYTNTDRIMRTLINSLPEWLYIFETARQPK